MKKENLAFIMKIKMIRKDSPLFLLMLLICIFPGWPQEITGSLEGRIVDDQGEPIALVDIIISGPSLQGIRKTKTDDRGYFRGLVLPVGIYTVKIIHQAYQEMTFQNVTIHLGKTTTLGEIRLQMKVVGEHEVVVSAERPLIDQSTASYGSNIQANIFEALPTDRDFRSIISLLPQANTSYYGDETNIAGSTGLENAYYIDGINVTNPYRSVTHTDLPYNFVKEIEVREGGYEAEYGRATGGIVNVITYSGGNEFQGKMFGFFTNSGLAGDPKFGLLDARVDAFSTYDFGLSLGGPVIRDKLWFFAAYNRSYENQDIEVPGSGFHRDKKDRHMFAGKLSWRASDRTQVVFMLIGDPATRHRVGVAELPFGNPTAVENPDPFLSYVKQGGINFSLQARSFIRDNFLLEAFVARYSRDDDFKGDTETGRIEPLLMDLSTNIWSGGVGLSNDVHSTRTSLKLTGTLFLGPHKLKAGIEYEQNLVENLMQYTQPGLIMKISDSEFSTLYVEFDAKLRNRIPTLFLQDSWQASKRLRLNIGIRWDGQYIIGSDGKLAQPITNQFQPRIGLTYQPGELGSQKLFASFGRFYQQIPLHTPCMWYTHWDNYSEIFTEDPRLPDAEPVFRIVYLTAEDPYFQKIDDLDGEHFDEYTAGYTRSFSSHFKLGIRGIYRSLRQAFANGYDGYFFFIGNPGKGDLSFLPRFKRNYTALELTFERTGGGKMNFAASYVLSRNYGNYSGLFISDRRWAQPNTYYCLQIVEQIPNSTGLLPNDRPHVFKLFGSYRLTPRLSAGIFFTWQSGTPLNEFGATYFFARHSYLVQRGSAGRTPSIWDLNLRLTYDIKGFLSRGFEGRLVLDILHVGSPRQSVDIDQVRYFNIDEFGNQINPNPNFNRAVRYQPPMTVRLGVEFGF